MRSVGTRGEIILEAQEHWQRQDLSIERVRFDFITDDAARLLALAQDSVDFMLNIPIEQSQQRENVTGSTVRFLRTALTTG